MLLKVNITFRIPNKSQFQKLKPSVLVNIIVS